MKTFISSLLGGLVALILFLVLVPIVIGLGIGIMAATSGGGNKAPTDAIVLEIDLRDDFADQPASSGPAVLFQTTSFIDILGKLDAAIDDDRVKGVYIRASEMGIGSSRAEELREAFLKLRAADKFIVAHSQGMMGAGPSTLRAISAADEIYLQPGSDIMVNGISLETLFFKDLFDNLSVKAEIEQFYEYKNSPNVYKETDYTEPHREAMTALASDMWRISLEDIAADRGFGSVSDLKNLLESGPLSPDEAVAGNIFDGLKWPEDAAEDVLEQAGESAEFLPIAQYHPALAKPTAPLIAVIGGEGAIITGTGDQGLFSDESVMASDPIAEAILKAGRDKNVEALVFRVDSPGGSPTASDQIWRAIERVQDEEGKPVVVSMGSVAASGGYYVSAGADAILANRTTITGSIGVYGGKLAIADGLRRIGINPSAITVGGEFASAFNTETFTEAQRAELWESLKRTYDRFLEIVSDGRGLDTARVHEIAKGRVWSGEAAKQIGLVNETGGYIDAIAKAKELAGIEAGTKVRVKLYPTPENPFQAFSELFGASAESAEAAATLNQVLGDERFQTLLKESLALQKGGTQMSTPEIREN
ncbi:signal peptide peptidase SppA [Ponticaulis profundi]|uniref:Signal peptide peptidase SppA n=1 Tax=Ponticaulis profundi TaxID=2665222 RepID=A0ABW1S7C0_9PROT